MRRFLFVAAPVLALALSGCPSKPKEGECKSSEDCASQQGYGPVCVEGRCQECGQDTDCKAGFACKQNKCVPRAECASDADCSGGRSCQDGKCVAAAPKPECQADSDCASGQGCQDGKCVTRQAAAAPGCPSDGRYDSIHFGFDEATITAESRGILERDAKCMQAAKPKRVTIAGNCDERGTTEYNLQLGQRRAEAARKYLVNLGLPAKSFKTVSYGKERPSCTEHTEDCWAKNRRADLTE